MKRSVCLRVLIALLLGTAAGVYSASALTLHYGEGAQVELVGASGVRVLIDVSDPDRLSAPAGEADVMLTTHTHADHYIRELVAGFQGRKLTAEAGSLELDGVAIRGIAASHSPGGGTNIIFVVEMDGLRIAHCGDLGQKELSEEQLAALGRIDIAVMQFDNNYSQMNVRNKNGFNMMIRLGPALIIPTHNSSAAARHAMTLWPCLYSDEVSLTFSREDIPGDTRLLFLGYSARRYAEITGAARWGE